MELFGWKQHITKQASNVFILIAKNEWDGVGDLRVLREEAIDRTEAWCREFLMVQSWNSSRIDHIAVIHVGDELDAVAFKMRWV